ncbi:MAG: HAF repeat-containing protein [Pseudomonadota bacterium]
MRPALHCCLLVLILSGCEALAATRPLGIVAPGGESTIAYDINGAGQVAAVLEDEDGHQRGVLYEKGKITELGSLGGMYSDARRINERGEIVGSARKADGSWSAFLFDRAGGMRVLGTLGGPSSYGMALNQQGEAVGFADTTSGDWHAFFQHPGAAMKDLGTLGGKISYAAGINQQGQVVGTASLATEYRHAFLYDPVLGMVDLGTLGGRSSSATAINDSGMIVGASETEERRWHAFVYDGQKMIDLGALIGRGDSYATGINNAGHVVGTLLIGDERLSFVWRDNKMTVHRGGKGLHLTNAINDEELVIGATYDRRMIAATMVSNAPPVRPRGGSEFLFMVALVLVLASATVIYRKRYRGIPLRNYAP